MDSSITIHINVELRYKMRLEPGTPYSFRFSRTHYVIPAWYANKQALLRVLRLGSKLTDIFLMEIIADNEIETKYLSVDIYGAREVTADDTDRIRHTLLKTLHIESPKDPSLDRQRTVRLFEIMKKDPIVVAAFDYNGINIRGKLYPTLFEALCGIICSQRATFSRLPTMMGKMASRTTPGVQFKGYIYPAFPYASEIVQKGEDVLRECGLGFRARRIFQLADAWEKNNVDEMEKSNSLILKEELLRLPGVGPYTANLALTLTGRIDSDDDLSEVSEPHIDSFVRTVIGHFYFNGEVQSEEDTLIFVKNRWGEEAEGIIGHLTTNTHEWATSLGFNLPVRSGAKALYQPEKI